MPQKLRSGNAARKSVMKALMSSWPFRGSCSEYFSSMSGAAISSTTPKVAGLAPEVGEPAADDGLVVVLQAHMAMPFDCCPNGRRLIPNDLALSRPRGAPSNSGSCLHIEVGDGDASRPPQSCPPELHIRRITGSPRAPFLNCESRNRSAAHIPSLDFRW